MADCLFCGIVAKEVPADIVAETEGTVAFRDINPQAPTHILVIPREHYPNIGAVADANPELATEILRQAAAIAEGEGLDDGWRLVCNTGKGAGQTVFHAHAHVLGGRGMKWPPG